MKKTILSLCLMSLFGFSSTAQTNYDVEVLNFMFTPNSLTIDVGDTVTWTNFGGTHNVNGTTATFPNNPASFDNGAPATGWTYFFVFTIAGTYDYQCDPHVAGGMIGEITVIAPSSIDKTSLENDLSVFPNPFSDAISIKIDKSVLDNNSNIEFVLYDLLGNQVQRISKINSNLTRVETDHLSNGIYIYAFKVGGKILKTGKLTNN